MNFPFVLPEEDRIHAHISQRSQLKYIKEIFDKFDSSQQEQFRNSCFRHLIELLELQFSAQLMQQLLFRLVESGKINELWFNFNGHYSRLGLHEYTIVTGLKCGPRENTEEYEKTLKKKRLKERYFKGSDRVTCGDLERVLLHSSTPRADRYKLGLALLVEGVFIALENNTGIDLNTCQDTPMHADEQGTNYSPPQDRSEHVNVDIPIESATHEEDFAQQSTQDDPLDERTGAITVYNPPVEVTPLTEELVDVQPTGKGKRRSTRTMVPSVITRSPYTRSGRKRSRK